MHDLWLFLLPIAAISGWVAATISKRTIDPEKSRSVTLPKDYLVGLDLLLNEEPDKAIDFFIKMLEVDSDTVETHLALGYLFRKRGEVERATRIHQNLIARPNLDKTYRLQALMSLAKDYLSAGVFDRAEQLFLELMRLGGSTTESLKCLLDIYQQEKEWQKAINTAKKLETISGNSKQVSIAHYYCELAELCCKDNDVKAIKFLKKALSIDRKCIRASLLIAEIESNAERYNQSIRHLKNVECQDADFFSEAIIPLMCAYKKLGKEGEMILFFEKILKESPKSSLALILSNQIQQLRGDKIAADFVIEHLKTHPSVKGLHRLFELYLSLAEGKVKEDFKIFYDLTEKMIIDCPGYKCIRCGFSGKAMHWFCPTCKNWGVIKPV